LTCSEAQHIIFFDNNRSRIYVSESDSLLRNIRTHLQYTADE